MTTMLLRTSASRIALLAGASLAVSAGVAFAQDPFSGPTPGNWSGPYIGLHAGYGWGEWDGKFFDHKDKVIPYVRDGEHLGKSVDLDGFLGGAQFGYNFQSGPFVFGVEGDIAWSDISGSEEWHKTNHGNWDWRLESDINWLATLRGRAGITNGPALFYLTGGLAFADVDSRYSLAKGERTWSGKASDTLTGWTAGGGVEFALGQSWSMKAEYLYIDLGKTDVILDDEICWKPEEFDGDLNLHTFRIGFNYNFGS